MTLEAVTWRPARRLRHVNSVSVLNLFDPIPHGTTAYHYDLRTWDAQRAAWTPFYRSEQIPGNHSLDWEPQLLDPESAVALQGLQHRNDVGPLRLRVYAHNSSSSGSSNASAAGGSDTLGGNDNMSASGGGGAASHAPSDYEAQSLPHLRRPAGAPGPKPPPPPSPQSCGGAAAAVDGATPAVPAAAALAEQQPAAEDRSSSSSSGSSGASGSGVTNGRRRELSRPQQTALLSSEGQRQEHQQQGQQLSEGEGRTLLFGGRGVAGGECEGGGRAVVRELVARMVSRVCGRAPPPPPPQQRAASGRRGPEEEEEEEGQPRDRAHGQRTEGPRQTWSGAEVLDGQQQQQQLDIVSGADPVGVLRPVFGDEDADGSRVGVGSVLRSTCLGGSNGAGGSGGGSACKDGSNTVCGPMGPMRRTPASQESTGDPGHGCQGSAGGNPPALGAPGHHHSACGSWEGPPVLRAAAGAAAMGDEQGGPNPGDPGMGPSLVLAPEGPGGGDPRRVLAPLPDPHAAPPAVPSATDPPGGCGLGSVPRQQHPHQQGQGHVGPGLMAGGGEAQGGGATTPTTPTTAAEPVGDATAAGLMPVPSSSAPTGCVESGCDRGGDGGGAVQQAVNDGVVVVNDDRGGRDPGDRVLLEFVFELRDLVALEPQMLQRVWLVNVPVLHMAPDRQPFTLPSALPQPPPPPSQPPLAPPATGTSAGVRRGVSAGSGGSGWARTSVTADGYTSGGGAGGGAASTAQWRAVGGGYGRAGGGSGGEGGEQHAQQHRAADDKRALLRWVLGSGGIVDPLQSAPSLDSELQAAEQAVLGGPGQGPLSAADAAALLDPGPDPGFIPGALAVLFGHGQEPSRPPRVSASAAVLAATTDGGGRRAGGGMAVPRTLDDMAGTQRASPFGRRVASVPALAEVAAAAEAAGGGGGGVSTGGGMAPSRGATELRATAGVVASASGRQLLAGAGGSSAGALASAGASVTAAEETTRVTASTALGLAEQVTLVHDVDSGDGAGSSSARDLMYSAGEAYGNLARAVSPALCNHLSAPPSPGSLALSYAGDGAGNGAGAATAAAAMGPSAGMSRGGSYGSLGVLAAAVVGWRTPSPPPPPPPSHGPLPRPPPPPLPPLPPPQRSRAAAAGAAEAPGSYDTTTSAQGYGAGEVADPLLLGQRAQPSQQQQQPGQVQRLCEVLEVRASIRRLTQLQERLHEARVGCLHMRGRLAQAAERRQRQDQLRARAEAARVERSQWAARAAAAEARLVSLRAAAAEQRRGLQERACALEHAAGVLQGAEVRRLAAEEQLQGPTGRGHLAALTAALVGRRNRLVAELGRVFQIGPMSAALLQPDPLDLTLDSSWAGAGGLGLPRAPGYPGDLLRHG